MLFDTKTFKRSVSPQTDVNASEPATACAATAAQGEWPNIQT